MKENVRKSTLNLSLSALFTAVIAVLSQVAVPLPTHVPVTLQTFAVALCGYVLGVKWGLASITAYVILGSVGVPVFSGFKGGVQTLFGATGGFIFGFIAFAALCGLSLYVKGKPIKLLMGMGGLAVCHILGAVQFSLIYKTGIMTAFLTVSLPYSIKDIISVIAAFFLANYIRKLIAKIH